VGSGGRQGFTDSGDPRFRLAVDGRKVEVC
jgi:hypothetical protein